LELKVRRHDEAQFSDGSWKFGLEIFRDENNGNLIYISDTGALAVLPPAAINLSREARSPRWLYGLELKVRPDGAGEFTDATPKLSLEVFRDENTGNLIYIDEKGAIGAVSGVQPAGGATKSPEWLARIVQNVLRAGQASMGTRSASLEVFRDANTGVFIYVNASGALAVTHGEPGA
jgi:hypothetical protein